MRYFFDACSCCPFEQCVAGTFDSRFFTSINGIAHMPRAQALDIAGATLVGAHRYNGI